MKIKFIVDALNARLIKDRESRGIQKKGNFTLVLAVTPALGQYRKFELMLNYIDENLDKQRVITVQETLPCLSGLEGEARDKVTSQMLTEILAFMCNDYGRYI